MVNDFMLNFPTFHRLPQRVLLWLMLTVLVGCGESVPVIAPLPSNANLLIFGDDFVTNGSLPPEQTYPALLGKLSGYRVSAAGVAGETTAQGLQRLRGALATHKPSALVLCHGWSDLFSQVDENDTIDALRSMVGLAQHQGVPVVLVGLPVAGAPGEFRPLWYYGKIAKAFKIPYQNSAFAYALMEKDQHVIHEQNVELSALGHQKVAEGLWELLRRAQRMDTP